MKNKNFWFKQITKLCFSLIILFTTLIILKAKPELKDVVYYQVYEKNISFSTINSIYEKYVGSALPFDNLFKEETNPVFNESLEYSEANKYLDGVKLTVNSNYLVPALDSGLVIFIGEKENYGKTIIIQQANGIDVWYSGIDTTSVKLYDYVDKGSFVGEVAENIFYLVFKKDGEVLDYQNYI